MLTIKNLYNTLLNNKEDINKLHKKGFKTFQEYESYNNNIQNLYAEQNKLIKKIHDTIEKKHRQVLQNNL